jgi:hypothetical protein
MADMSKRGWSQFRLRTLLMAIALIGAASGYVAHEWRIVLMRKAMLNAATPGLMYIDGTNNQIPLVRRLLGDRGCKCIIVYDPTRKERYRAAFPESYVVYKPYDDGNNWLHSLLEGDSVARPIFRK